MFVPLTSSVGTIPTSAVPGATAVTVAAKATEVLLFLTVTLKPFTFV